MPIADYMKDYFEEDGGILLERIQNLQRKCGCSLMKKIEDNHDIIHFYSWLSEVRYGLLFDQFCTELKYEQKLERKEIDWTLTVNNQKIAAEVLRINRIPEDELRAIITDIHEIKRINKELGYTKYIPKIPTVVMKGDHFYGAKGLLDNKIKSYSKLITKYKMPLMICLTTIAHRPIEELDTFDSLIGSNKKGYFYTDEKFKKNITGVLLKAPMGDFSYFHNENAEIQLNPANYGLFQAYAYKEKY